MMRKTYPVGHPLLNKCEKKSWINLSGWHKTLTNNWCKKHTLSDVGAGMVNSLRTGVFSDRRKAQTNLASDQLRGHSW